ncbi:MAG: hypothetical protein F2557_03295 [Actinobacteria bacterium]|uniref:Unannotated protein n=1 Tax=freshwater metagenome TaxID=449393 RepID=A0A6J6E366_9ZZZZ|nr:hypothetical protein [Actinomycetota bacterium]
MSTKTTFKRIALVAVAALGFGLLSVVPSNAGANPNLTLPTVGTAAQTVAVGSIASTTVGFTATGLAASEAWGSTNIATVSITRPATSTVAKGDRDGAGAGTDSVLDTSTATTALGTGALSGGNADSGTSGGTAVLTGTTTSAYVAPTSDVVVAGTVRLIPDVPGVYQVTITLSGGGSSGTATAFIYAYLAAPNGATLVGERGDGGLPSNNSVVNAVAGVANTVQVRAFPSTTVRSLIVVDGASSSIVTSTLNDGTTASGTLAAGTNPTSLTIPSQTAQSGNNANTTIVTIATPVVGTATVRIFRETAASSGIYSSTASATVTINVAASRSSGVISTANSSVLGNVADADATAATNTTAAATSHTATASTTFKTRVDVVGKDTLNNLMPAATTAPVSVTITGPGFISLASNGTGLARVLALPWTSTEITAGETDFYTYSDGTSGTATVTVSWGTTVIGTQTLVFTGSARTVTVGNLEPHITAAATAAAFWVQAVDSNSNPVAYTTVTSSSSDPTVLSNNVSCAASPMSAADRALVGAPLGAYLCAVTGIGVGTATLTIAPGSTTTNSPTLSFRVTKTTIATLELTTDKSEYAPGEKIKLSLVAKDADGNLLGARDAGYDILAKFSVNQALTGTAIPLSALAISAGAYATDYFAPLIPGTVTFSATTEAGSPLATALQNVTITRAVTITGGPSQAAAEAAADAAAEATDAANAATDAANAAAEAADAATAAAQDAADAVAALATSVEAMVNALKRQITSLTNLVIKIQKKVRA